MAKKKSKVTASEAGAAEAQGLTPGQFEAEYATPAARSKAGGTAAKPKGGDPDTAEIAKLKKELSADQSKLNQKQGQDAYTALADKQAQEYLDQTNKLDPLISGQAIPTIEANASQQASQMLGASATSPVSQWLNAQTQAAQAQNAPVAAAMGDVGKAQDSAAQLEAAGVKNMGAAESQLMQAAPYQQLLQSLAQEVPYHLASGWSIPGLTQANTPQWLQQAESNVGVQSLPASSGTSPSAKGLLPSPTATGGAVSPLYTPPTTPPTTQ
jgi:hypothetical protein